MIPDISSLSSTHLKIEKETFQDLKKRTSLDTKISSLVVEYMKGETKTRDVVPTLKEKMGRDGDVHIHRIESHLVVKKDNSDMQRLRKEFDIGILIDHPSVVKFHKFYIKKSSGREKHKLLMDKIEGTRVSDQRAHLKIPLLLQDLKNCYIYLNHQGIAWEDLNDTNLFIQEDGHLKICDLEFWNLEPDSLKRNQKLFLGFAEAVHELMRGDAAAYKKAKQIAFPQEFFGQVEPFDMASVEGIHAYKNEDWFINVTQKFLKAKGDEGIVSILDEYVSSVLNQYNKEISQ